MAPRHRAPIHVFLLCAAVFAVAVATGCGQAEMKTGEGGAAKAGPGAGSVPAHFQATIYEVHLAPATISQLEARALVAKGPTAAEFEKALEAIGKTKALYQVDQSLNPAKDMITVGTRVPMVTGTRITQEGGAINTVQYQQVGAIFRFSADPAKASRKGLELQLGVEVSGIIDTGIDITKGVKAAAIRSYNMTYTGPVELGKPFVFFSVDAAVKDADGNAVGYVCRAVLGDAKP